MQKFQIMCNAAINEHHLYPLKYKGNISEPYGSIKYIRRQVFLPFWSYVFIYVFIYWFIYLFIYLLFIYLFIYLFVSYFIYLFVYLFIYLIVCSFI